jgi:hypothetical protein
MEETQMEVQIQIMEEEEVVEQVAVGANPSSFKVLQVMVVLVEWFYN